MGAVGRVASHGAGWRPARQHRGRPGGLARNRVGGRRRHRCHARVRHRRDPRPPRGPDRRRRIAPAPGAAGPRAPAAPTRAVRAVRGEPAWPPTRARPADRPSRRRRRGRPAPASTRERCRAPDPHRPPDSTRAARASHHLCHRARPHLLRTAPAGLRAVPGTPGRRRSPTHRIPRTRPAARDRADRPPTGPGARNPRVESGPSSPPVARAVRGRGRPGGGTGLRRTGIRPRATTRYPGNAGSRTPATTTVQPRPLRAYSSPSAVAT